MFIVRSGQSEGRGGRELEEVRRAGWGLAHPQPLEREGLTTRVLQPASNAQTVDRAINNSGNRREEAQLRACNSWCNPTWSGDQWDRSGVSKAGEYTVRNAMYKTIVRIFDDGWIR